MNWLELFFYTTGVAFVGIFIGAGLVTWMNKEVGPFR